MNKLTHRIYSKTEFLGPPMGEIRESINHRFSISLDARYWGNNRGTREGMQFMGDYEDINFFLNSGSFGDLKIEPILTSAPQVSVPHPNLSSVRVVCNNCSGVFDHLSDGTISECPHCYQRGQVLKVYHHEWVLTLAQILECFEVLNLIHNTLDHAGNSVGIH